MFQQWADFELAYEEEWIYYSCLLCKELFVQSRTKNLSLWHTQTFTQEIYFPDFIIQQAMGELFHLSILWRSNVQDQEDLSAQLGCSIDELDSIFASAIHQPEEHQEFLAEYEMSFEQWHELEEHYQEIMKSCIEIERRIGVPKESFSMFFSSIQKLEAKDIDFESLGEFYTYRKPHDISHYVEWLCFVPIRFLPRQEVHICSSRILRCLYLCRKLL